MNKKIFLLLFYICITLYGCTNITESKICGDDLPLELKEYMSKNIKISDNKCVEYEGWLDDEEKCYRVAIEYKEEQQGKYRHSEDYFLFFSENEIECVYVDYTKEQIGADRYVWDACDFSAYLEDVTFDDKLDLIISLGHAGASGDLVYCAYVYNDGKYVYVKSFEEIVNYKLDRENKLIISGGSDSCVYQYNGEEFLKKVVD